MVDLKEIERSGISSVALDHGDHILVLYFDKEGRARGTEVHKFVSTRKEEILQYKTRLENLTIDQLNIKNEIKTKLIEHGLANIKDIIWIHPNKLSKILEINQEEAENLMEKIIEIYDKYQGEYLNFIKGSTITTLEEKRIFLHTGSKNLDKILMGGYSSGEVTEITGEYRTGKTQLCLTATVTAFLPIEKGGLKSEEITVAIIDAEKTFNPERVKKIAKRFKLEPRKILDMILVGRPKNTLHQKKMINNLTKLVKKENTKLIIVDSITKLPRIDYQARKKLYERQRQILEMIETLQRITKNYNTVTLITNQVVADITNNTNQYKPAGGHILSHNIDTRLLLQYINKETRKIEIIDSNWLPPTSTEITITEEGIKDPQK